MVVQRLPRCLCACRRGPVQVRRLLEQDRWHEAIQLHKRKDHFIFTIESTGCIPADQLMRAALAILEEKCERLAGRL